MHPRPMSARLAVLPLLAVALVGCTRNPVTGSHELIWTSTAKEIAIGREAAPNLEQQYGGRVYDPMLANYVEQVGQRIAAVSDRPMPYSFTLVRSETPNAFALPGGKIFITVGLLVHMTSERELAAVLAHEVTHVAAMHNVKAMERETGRSMFLNVLGWVIGGWESLAVDVVSGMVNLHYSRGDEYEADRYGIRYLTRAGYNPWGMVELLTVLQEVSSAKPFLFTEMFATHPVTDKRIEKAEAVILQDPAYSVYPRSVPDPNAGRFQVLRLRLPLVVPGLELPEGPATQPGAVTTQPPPDG